MRARALAAAPAATLVAVALCASAPSPASAAPLTSDGQRCTVVGTSRADLLRGTSGHDVICGQGGNDQILGRGGSDVVDGGPGRDSIAGGAGTDELIGGGGDDSLDGGLGGDTLSGDAGNDELSGQAGDDDLTGGIGTDTLDGGAGTNWCTVDAVDVENRCAYDEAPPDVASASLDQSTVDVTDAPRFVQVRAHLTDDTGVASASAAADSLAGGHFLGDLSLVSGTPRDGWWEGGAEVRRWSKPGQFTLLVSARDRVGRSFERTIDGVTLDVIDRNPDVTGPSVTLLTPTPDVTYDVRAGSASVTLRARVSDDVSGVWYVALCLYHRLDDYLTNLPCADAERVSGDDADGTWRGTVQIPKRSVGGDWNVEVEVSDVAANQDSWAGPELYRIWTDDGRHPDPSTSPLPDGMGRFTVLGTSDTNPPAITSVAVTPTEVDTLAGPATVHVTVQAEDIEGVQSIGGSFSTLSPSPADPGSPWFDLDLRSGSATSGMWEGDVVLPQGLPPGTYYLGLYVDDVNHSRAYLPADHQDTGSQPIAGDDHVTVVDSSG